MSRSVPSLRSTRAIRRRFARLSRWNVRRRKRAFIATPSSRNTPLAEDYVAIAPLRQVTTKKDRVSARKSGQLRYDTIDVTDMVVRLYGNTAIVTARADVKGHQLGEDFSGPYRYTRVWVRRFGRWQAVSYQATVTQ